MFNLHYSSEDLTFVKVEGQPDILDALCVFMTRNGITPYPYVPLMTPGPYPYVPLMTPGAIQMFLRPDDATRVIGQSARRWNDSFVRRNLVRHGRDMGGKMKEKKVTVFVTKYWETQGIWQTKGRVSADDIEFAGRPLNECYPFAPIEPATADGIWF